MMQLIPVTLSLLNLDPIMLFRIAVVMLPVFTALMFSFLTEIFNYNIIKLDQIKQSDLPLSEFHYRVDNKEHEYKIRIDRKRNIVYSKDF